MTPRQLFDWAIDNIPAMAFKYLNMDDYKSEQILLEQCFKQSRTIPGIPKLHCFIALSRNKVFTKVYSSSAISKIERVTVQEEDLVLEEIKGFVTCAYNGCWWLACVMQVNEDTDIISMSLLHPHGPSRSFKYPLIPDIVNISIGDVLTSVDTRCGKSHTYSLTQRASRAATEKFKLVKKPDER